MNIPTDSYSIGTKYARNLILIPILFFSFTAAKAQIPPGYYNPAIGKTGETLQVALYNIIKGHTAISYANVWNAFYTTDVKLNGKVWDMYSDIPGGTPPYEYTLGTDQCGTANSEGDCYSREHSFPKSWFNDTSPMNTDLFHICPVDQYVNNMHSNYPFGMVYNPTWTSLNGSKKGPCSSSGYTGTVFEPRDEYKGDFARSYFYMATRYENVIASWPAYDPNCAAALDGTSYPAFKNWYLNLLIDWHTQDPVSSKEIARNDSVYQIQSNRNPYIDHPEYVTAVWTPAGPQAEPTSHVTGFAATEGSPSYSAVKLDWSDATGTVIPDGYLLRGSSISLAAIQAPVDSVPITDGGLDKNISSGSETWAFAGLSPSTTYYFKIFSYTNSGTNINYKTDGTVPMATETTTAGISFLQPGDIAIIEMDVLDPEKFSFITLKQLNPGTIINFTDNGFTSPTACRTGEGFLAYTSPTALSVGTVVSWQRNMSITGTGWNSAAPGNFEFNNSGDQLFAYQGSWGTDLTVIYGVQVGNALWLTSGPGSSTTSYLPAVLVSNISALAFTETNGNYNLLTSGTVNVLGSLMAHPANWTKSPNAIATPAWNFIVTPATVINQNATVQNLLVGNGETITVSAAILFTVLGTFTISPGN